MQVTLIVNGVPVVTTVEDQDQTNQTNAQALQAATQATLAAVNDQPPPAIVAAVDQTALVDVTLAMGTPVT